MKKLAFTLAEVLIVLGIIGVVAAMTIPTLMQKYRESKIETSLKKFYTNVNQAIKLSELDNGAQSDWDEMTDISVNSDKSLTDDEKGQKMSLSTKAWFDKYLAKYMRVIKSENSNLSLYLTTFEDGTVVAWHSYAIYVYPNGDDAKKCLSLSPSDSKKECSGKKYWTFLWYGRTILGKGIEPYAYNSTFDSNKNNNYNGCNANVTNEPAECSSVIAKNGWKIPNDYPFKL